MKIVYRMTPMSNNQSMIEDTSERWKPKICYSESMGIVNENEVFTFSPVHFKSKSCQVELA